MANSLRGCRSNSLIRNKKHPDLVGEGIREDEDIEEEEDIEKEKALVREEV